MTAHAAILPAALGDMVGSAKSAPTAISDRACMNFISGRDDKVLSWGMSAEKAQRATCIRFEA